MEYLGQGDANIHDAEFIAVEDVKAQTVTGLACKLPLGWGKVRV